jgi:hypothetical protein
MRADIRTSNTCLQLATAGSAAAASATSQARLRPSRFAPRTRSRASPIYERTGEPRLPRVCTRQELESPRFMVVRRGQKAGNDRHEPSGGVQEARRDRLEALRHGLGARAGCHTLLRGRYKVSHVASHSSSRAGGPRPNAPHREKRCCFRIIPGGVPQGLRGGPGGGDWGALICPGIWRPKGRRPGPGGEVGSRRRRAAPVGRGCEARAAPATQAYVSYVEETGRRATKQTRPNGAARARPGS